MPPVRRRWARLLLVVVALWAVLGPRLATAHEMSMAELTLREVSAGQFIWAWGSSGSSTPVAQVLSPRWPEGCVEAGDNALRCGSQGLAGPLRVEGVGQAYSAAVLRIHWLGGQTQVVTLTAAQPVVQLFGSADDRRSLGQVASAYLVLGIEHILGGIDHLLFVLALLFLVGFNRRLVGTITAFTLAHSITLALSALGWLSLRSAPVEASIALSIVLVAGEALRTRDTLARRVPAIVAFGFGLVHGLGFAGALREIGLPEQHLSAALLSFNLGVEAGQLAAVATVWGLHHLLRGQPWWARARRPALYAIGVVAAFWSWGRVAAVLGWA